MRSYSLHITPKLQKINPCGPFKLNYNSMNFVDKVIKSSTIAAITNVIASLSLTLDKENSVCQLAGPVSLKFG